MNKLFGLLLLMMLCFSCKTENKSPEAKVYQWAAQADKVFSLDDQTAFNLIQPQVKYIDGTLLYMFRNRANNQFYIYEYASGELKKNIQIYKEGPNQVQANLFPYYIHTLDSIYINPYGNIKYLINSQGEVIQKTEMESESDKVFENEKLVFDGATTVEEGKLLTGRRVELPKRGVSNPLRGTFDFTKGVFENLYLEEEVVIENYDDYVDRLTRSASPFGIITMKKFAVGNDDQLFASTQINDSIYEFKKGQFVQAYYAGDPATNTINFQGYLDKTNVETTANSISIMSKAEQPPFYTAMFMDTEKEWVYRVLIHGAKDSKGNDDFRDSELIGASLIAFNVKDKSSTVFSIPIDQVDINTFGGGAYFATAEGVHFPAKDQEVESEKRYKVFKIE